MMRSVELYAGLICFRRCWERLNTSNEKGQGAQLNQFSDARVVCHFQSDATRKKLFCGAAP